MVNLLITDLKESRWIRWTTVFSALAGPPVLRSDQGASGPGNYMGNAKSSWSNPQNAPPSCWKGLTDDT
jgi:hypothetical protein